MQQGAFWDQRAHRYDENIAKHDDVYGRTIDSTRSLLTSSDVVLDLGCASGEIGLDIALHVERLHGFDVSEKMIELARAKALRREAGNADFRCGDVLDERLAAVSKRLGVDV